MCPETGMRFLANDSMYFHAFFNCKEYLSMGHTKKDNSFFQITRKNYSQDGIDSFAYKKTILEDKHLIRTILEKL